MENFHIYENWQAGPHKAIIHRGSCGHCKDGHGSMGGSHPKHGRWLGPFPTLDAAENVSEGLPEVVVRRRHRCV